MLKTDMSNYSTTHQNTQQAKKVVGNLTGKHYNYLRFDRKIPRHWVVANFESITQKKAKEMGFSAPSDGILLKSALPSLQNQFRPDNPKVEKRTDGTERATKYVTPYGCEIDAMLPNHPEYPNFWLHGDELKKHCWSIDDRFYILITEGFIDALTLFCHSPKSTSNKK
ncbi:hypothetical protein PCC9214_01481 [Planktothrix tepida]|uniref:hypothetical protein n=1 Tax=Planktothrix tepida TaxID=1678309 RepID=UPI0020B25422|nr:hypothetical protein [Planktothrix tepida]CAD5934028.1 hypothetical protein PCC9214_01481 [Planktothrix tepida]